MPLSSMCQSFIVSKRLISNLRYVDHSYKFGAGISYCTFRKSDLNPEAIGFVQCAWLIT